MPYETVAAGSAVPTQFFVDSNGNYYSEVAINAEAMAAAVASAVGVLTAEMSSGDPVSLNIGQMNVSFGVFPAHPKRAVISTTEPIRFMYFPGSYAGATLGHTIGLNGTAIVEGETNILALCFFRDAQANPGEDAIITITLEA